MKVLCNLAMAATAMALAVGQSALRPLQDAPLAPAIVQSSLQADILRRSSELMALGWMGRAYLVAPWLFDRWFPAVFCLEPYDAADAAARTYRVEDDETLIECTLRESSVIARGIPFRLQIRTSEDQRSVESVTLIGIGCDLFGVCTAGDFLPGINATDLLATINTETDTKQLVVRSIVHTIFERLPGVARAARRGTELQLDVADVADVAAEVEFRPKRELWAHEGSREKWLQQVGGYWFAEARISRVRLAADTSGGGPQEATAFTFYLDETEPWNVNDPTRNVNPELCYCEFGGRTSM